MLIRMKAADMSYDIPLEDDIGEPMCCFLCDARFRAVDTAFRHLDTTSASVARLKEEGMTDNHIKFLLGLLLLTTYDIVQLLTVRSYDHFPCVLTTLVNTIQDVQAAIKQNGLESYITSLEASNYQSVIHVWGAMWSTMAVAYSLRRDHLICILQSTEWSIRGCIRAPNVYVRDVLKGVLAQRDAATARLYCRACI